MRVTKALEKALWKKLREFAEWNGVVSQRPLVPRGLFVCHGRIPYDKKVLEILNALCDEARNQGAKEFHCSYREKNLASRGLQDACGFKFDYRSEEKTDPRTGEIYVVVNTKKDLQYVV